MVPVTKTASEVAAIAAAEMRLPPVKVTKVVERPELSLATKELVDESSVGNCRARGSRERGRGGGSGEADVAGGVESQGETDVAGGSEEGLGEDGCGGRVDLEDADSVVLVEEQVEVAAGVGLDGVELALLGE